METLYGILCGIRSGIMYGIPYGNASGTLYVNPSGNTLWKLLGKSWRIPTWTSCMESCMESSRVSSLESMMDMLEEDSMESSVGIHTRFHEECLYANPSGNPLWKLWKKSLRESSMGILEESMENPSGNPLRNPVNESFRFRLEILPCRIPLGNSIWVSMKPEWISFRISIADFPEDSQRILQESDRGFP